MSNSRPAATWGPELSLTSDGRMDSGGKVIGSRYTVRNPKNNKIKIFYTFFFCFILYIYKNSRYKKKTEIQNKEHLVYSVHSTDCILILKNIAFNTVFARSINFYAVWILLIILQTFLHRYLIYNVTLSNTFYFIVYYHNDIFKWNVFRRKWINLPYYYLFLFIHYLQVTTKSTIVTLNIIYLEYEVAD